MKNCVASRHDRGFFVYAGPAPKGYEHPWFYLCYRAVGENQVIESVKTAPQNGCISLSTKVVIHYCPQCGAKLTDFYRTDYQKLMDPTLDDFPAGPASRA